jgi:hypothetical protein
MRIIFITLLFVLSCSEPEIVQTDSVKQVYYRYVFMTKLSTDSLQLYHKLDSLLKSYKVNHTDFNRFKTEVDSNIDYRYTIFKEFDNALDSNRMLDTLFQFSKNLQ